jgi:uncharacterized membrane protein YeaQ/YmgE (transglycosylase-associated protein family)
MLDELCFAPARRAIARVHGMPTAFWVFVISIPPVIGLLAGWLASWVAGRGWLLNLSLTVIGAYAGMFLLDQVFSFQFTHTDGVRELIVIFINYGIPAAIGAVVALIPAWLIARMR